MSGDEAVGRPDVIDMCELWLRLDFPASRELRRATAAIGRCSEQHLTKHDESSYRPLPPHMEGH